MIYMEEIMDTFKFPEFDMIAEDVVDKAVGSRNISDFSKATWNVLPVKAVRISLLPCRLIKLDDKALFPRREPTLKLDMSGEFAFLNKVTGRYYVKKYSDDMEIERDFDCTQ